MLLGVRVTEPERDLIDRALAVADESVSDLGRRAMLKEARAILKAAGELGEGDPAPPKRAKRGRA